MKSSYIPKLLTRNEFRQKVFERDNFVCVFCKNKALDAHHIIERKLWSDGGYYIDNGASVCEEHHLACERTDISVEQVREACKITHIVIPLHFYNDHKYDKWGNLILENGTRLKGELFFDESVQKIISNHLSLFCEYVKYQRTNHVPWSEGIHNDDRVIDSMNSFTNKRVIVTQKFDGENTSLYKNYTHARSIDSNNHPSRNWVKNFHSSISQDIPEKWRICGENMYVKHSIGYENLKSYFLGFSIWNEKNICLPWDETIEYFQLLGITPVDVIYDGIYDENLIRQLYNSKKDWDSCEGYVIRTFEEFSYGEFKHKVAKFVRKGHVLTTTHWMHGQPLVKNIMK